MQNETKNENFIEKEFQEMPGGHYDELNFYFTPNGSKKLFKINSKKKKAFGIQTDTTSIEKD